MREVQRRSTVSCVSRAPLASLSRVSITHLERRGLGPRGITVELRRAATWRRRYEGTKKRSCHFASAAAGLTAGLQGARESQKQAALDHELFVFAVLGLPDARSAWRRKPVGDRLAHWAPAGSSFFECFDSSSLRRPTVGTSQRGSGIAALARALGGTTLMLVVDR